jgi:hypothetical protein
MSLYFQEKRKVGQKLPHSRSRLLDDDDDSHHQCCHYPYKECCLEGIQVAVTNQTHSKQVHIKTYYDGSSALMAKSSHKF